MTTTTPERGALVPVAEPLFTLGERRALGGFLASYSGQTRDAYTLDLRQNTAWCTQSSTPSCGHRDGTGACTLRAWQVASRRPVDRRLPSSSMAR